jgi:hypothetical protein
MDKIVVIAECAEPTEDRKTLRKKYYPTLASFMIDKEIKHVWESEKPNPLQDYDWIELANIIFGAPLRFTGKQQKEIWRQVYRIASDRL